MTTTTQTCQDVQATINYYLPAEDGSHPETNDLPLILGRKQLDARKMTMHDLRGREQDFSLYDNGFKVVKHEAQLKDFTDPERIKAEYYTDMEAMMLKEIPGAEHVRVLNHIIRNASPFVATDPQDAKVYLQRPQGPATRVHVDQTPFGALQFLSAFSTSEEVEKITSKRWGIINAWRPIKTIQCHPLAITDRQSVAKRDLVRIDRVYSSFFGQNYLVKAGGNQDHRWYYVSQQQPDEVLFISIFDSGIDGGGGTPHSAFEYPGTEDMPTRESIEVRAIVCFKDKA